MSCPHGNHPDGCERCAEIADHERAYELLFKENAKLRAEVERVAAQAAPTEPKTFTDEELRAEVKLRIERSGQTQEGYAKAHGYSPQYLSDFLTGKRLPGDKILQGEGLQAQTLYLDSMAVRVGVTGHNRFATRGDAGNLACKKCGARGLFTQIHQRPDGSDCGYLAHIALAQPSQAPVVQAGDASAPAVRMLTKDEHEELEAGLGMTLYFGVVQAIQRKFCAVNAGKRIPPDGKIGGAA